MRMRRRRRRRRRTRPYYKRKAGNMKMDDGPTRVHYPGGGNPGWVWLAQYRQGDTQSIAA